MSFGILLQIRYSFHTNLEFCMVQLFIPYDYDKLITILSFLWFGTLSHKSYVVTKPTQSNICFRLNKD